MTRRARGPSGEHGLLSTELAILMPILVLFALVAMFAVQVQRHGGRTQSAVDAAARAASLHRQGNAAVVASAQSAAEQVCLGAVSDVTVDWNGPVDGELRPGHVAVALTCTERFSGLAALVGSPERSVRATVVATLEYWRAP